MTTRREAHAAGSRGDPARWLAPRKMTSVKGTVWGVVAGFGYGVRLSAMPNPYAPRVVPMPVSDAMSPVIAERSGPYGNGSTAHCPDLATAEQ